MTAIETFVNMRERIRAYAESIPRDKALIIPEGFNNNIAWNVCHLVVTQQLLCYKLSGLSMALDEETIAMYAKGSSPADWSGEPDLDAMYPLLTELASKFAQDYGAGMFEEYTSYKTSAGLTLSNIDEAIAFNNFHEGLHLGYIMALSRAI